MELNKYLQCAKNSLEMFLRLMMPNIKIAKHHKLIIDKLEQVEKRKIKRLIVTLPPRHSKSLLCSEYFPAWFLGKNPDKFIIASTYSQTYASEIGRKVRNICLSEMFANIFRVFLAKDSKAKNKFNVENNTGVYYGVGAGASITGRGAHCLTGETKVLTSSGECCIKDIINNTEVLSYEHSNGRLEYRKVLANRKLTTNKLYEITTLNGTKIRATADHRFFIKDKGYIETQYLQSGDRLIQYDNKAMCNMWQRKREITRKRLSTMLLQIKKSLCSFEMCKMRDSIRQTPLRLREVFKERTQRFLLFFKMFRATPCYKKSKKMLDLWATCGTQNKKILPNLQTKCKQRIQNFTRQSMSFLWENICCFKRKKTILLKNMCRQRTFNKNDWRQKFSFQRWRKFIYSLADITSSYIRKGFESLRELRCHRNICILHKSECANHKIQSACASHRHGLQKQFHTQPNIALQQLSCYTSSLKEEKITMVKELCCGEVDVYDIQVEGNHNFFANEILTHNCLIIDDPYKNREEAYSKTKGAKVKAWFGPVAYSRLMPGGTIIVIQTRWKEDDLAGWLIKEHKHDGWEVINFPAIAESDDVLGRKVGDPLWSEFYDKYALNKIRMTLGETDWLALYQQRPIAEEGGIFKKNWFEYYHVLPSNAYKVQSWDTAYKLSDTSSFTVGQTWAVVDNKYYLIDQVRKRMEYPELKRQVINQYHTHLPNAVLVEDKASGQSLVQDLRRTTGIPIIPIKPIAGDKELRAQLVSPLCEARLVQLPYKKPDWLLDFFEEIVGFPNGQFDDQVDAMSQALSYLKNKNIITGAKIINAMPHLQK